MAQADRYPLTVTVDYPDRELNRLSSGRRGRCDALESARHRVRVPAHDRPLSSVLTPTLTDALRPS